MHDVVSVGHHLSVMKSIPYLLGGVIIVGFLALSWWVFTDDHRSDLRKFDIIMHSLAGDNARLLDTYGEVRDQCGYPVPNMKITAKIGWYVDFTHSGGEDRDTETDKQGRFNFVGIRGAGVGFILQKEGYEYNPRLPSQSRPNDYVPDPLHPIIFSTWKFKGAEPMTFTRIHTAIPCNGTATVFNLQTGRPTLATDGVTIKLTRMPVDIVRGKPFNWSIVLEIPDGGLVERADPYPYEAPATGYQASVQIDMPANMPNWSSNLKRSFYFEGHHGAYYGRATIDVVANFQPPPTLFDAEVYANPSGSRNLEYDPQQRIKSP